MMEGEVELAATPAPIDEPIQPSAGASDVTTTQTRDLVRCDDVTDDVRDDDAFLAGFRDCRREAIRYLRLRDADVGDELERHLAAVERTWRHRAPCDDDGPPAVSPSPHRSAHDDGNDSALGVSLVDEDDERLHEQSEAKSEPSQVERGELSENACELMRLAQNNPRINNILNELFTLMDDDDDDDDDCLMTCDADDALECSHDPLTSTSHDDEVLPHQLS